MKRFIALFTIFILCFESAVFADSKESLDTVITVPKDAEVFVGTKIKHFMDFKEIPAQKREADENSDTISYYYEIENDTSVNYRISGDEYITYTGIFNKTQDISLEITEDMLKPEGKTKDTVLYDTDSNNGYNVSDIFLNINPKGCLRLSKGGTYQLLPVRIWQTVDNVVNNYFFEPDFHYEICDENGEKTDDIVSIDKNNLLTAKNDGVAIVLVTYDSMTVTSAVGGPFFGALWPENTGVFVVCVGDKTENNIEMTINEGENDSSKKLSRDFIDSELDVIYYSGECGYYDFLSEKDINVYIANPKIDDKMTFCGFEKVEKDEKGKYHIPLTEGRNIIKTEEKGISDYQIITAKKVNVTVNNGEKVYRGDKLNIVFDKVYHPVNKVAGIYNMYGQPVYKNVSGYENKIVGGEQSQYNFADNIKTQTVKSTLKEQILSGMITYRRDKDIVIPNDYMYDTFTLSGGMIYVTGLGDPCGNHRNTDKNIGKDANMSATPVNVFLGRLPDIEIPVFVTDAEVVRLDIDTTNFKTEYYSGESIDKNSLTVKAIYDDETEQIVKNYSIIPDVLTEDTESVEITYRDVKAYIPVNVTADEVTSIEVKTLPYNTKYSENEMFDTTGMEVFAKYKSGKIKKINEYTYYPTRELKESDTEIKIIYKNNEDIFLKIPITVIKSSGAATGASSDDIKVYFTLYGDKLHGENGNIHTYKNNDLEKWINKKAVTVSKNSYIADVLKKVFASEGMSYTLSNNSYVEMINGLSEFDNGALSGWMYMINGEYSELGINEQKVKNGDNIIFHYSDDYTVEKSSQKWNTSGGLSDNKKENDNEKEEIKNENKKEDIEENLKDNIEKKEQKDNTTNVFKDVSENDWFYDELAELYSKGIIKGATETEFLPYRNVTRAMFVTMLYRLEGEPKVEDAGFSDVEADSYYSKAVSWAKKNNIVNGVTKTEFKPQESITREQIAVMLCRYAGYKKGEAVYDDFDLSLYSDSKEISEYALEAMRWALSMNIIKGYDGSVLMPKNNAARAEVVVMLARYLFLK